MNRQRFPSGENECARAIEAATVQIELALSETYAPVQELGDVIQNLAVTLGKLSEKQGTDPEIDDMLKQLRTDLSNCIVKLQFHDRMVQHLTHVRDYLASIANQLLEESNFDPERTSSYVNPWPDLHERIRQRLISDAEREVLDLVLDKGLAAFYSESKRNDFAAQGSIDLF